MRTLNLTLLLAISATISACGGGGGSDDGNTTVSSNPIQITQSNSREVASQGYNSDTSSRSTSSALSGLNPYSGTSTRSTGQVSDTCTYSGSFSLTATFANDDYPFETTGDSLSFSFNNCVDPDMTIDGSLSMKVLAATTSLDSLELDMDTTITSAGEIISAKGKMVITETDNSTEITSDSFTATVNGQTFSTTNLRLTDSFQSDDSLVSTVSARYSSPNLGGWFDVTTEEPLKTEYMGEYPYFGVVRYSGANGSYVELDASTSSESTVQITTFDGSTTASEIVDWADIIELL